MKTLTCTIIVMLSFFGCGDNVQDSDPSHGKSDVAIECGGQVEVNGECIAQGAGCPVTAVLLEDPRLIQSFAPVLITDCLPGGNIGRDVSYYEEEQHGETRSRSLRLELDDCSHNELPEINFSSVFGLDVTARVSTENNSSLDLQGQILPGNYGVFYRQTAEVQRVAVLLNAQDEVVGRALLTDWIYTAELATGPSCIPETSLQASARACDGDCDDTAELQ